ncbi:quinone-dependent dihydroorotate dehydrogenase [Metapseudomonas lalkuanensis]|uniref:Dihydroorotate dehydrogenase (quinone) n=1 Tax=Metapseudomonas lalkuanensis TaxID=2604832 RepID=A0A5J6QHS4_9GAMM|nr:quinone-dependent dihydroorotate dehydrogenase [Pseudomonas lalkuanensis]QEY62308.1 quinone-dependent dihydroorotate dehydrogenase [Pseudomonas lalkuanensis]UCP00160.1 quinone-dependent dihydroorotate dehydrogenase [Pseudomonas lalkuanensis]
MYKLARELLFSLSPETSHELSIDLIGAGGRLGLNRLLTKAPASLPVKVMGLEFPNPVGLAAGLDKNGDAIDGFAQLGFGFVEIGTVTPRPQPGNPKPRLFRLPQAEAIINRMGFNNQGVDHLLARVRAAKYDGVLGINIGKNFDTPVERAVDDYLICLDKVYAHASYVTVNVSSPNTPGLRSLQFGDSLKQLLQALRSRQESLAAQHGRHVPLAIKIAPDMSDEETAMVAQALLESGMDAVIATNTTLGREGVEGLPHGDEAGGLSGAPVREKSTNTVKVLAAELGGRLPIIAVGGITEGRHAAEKIAAGASLVQIYSGFIYKGPALIREAVDAIAGLQK